MGVATIVCGRILPVIVLVLAIIIGWFASHELPLGVFFATVVPITQGHLPPTIVGHGKMKGTPEFPSKEFVTPKPRPSQETFLELPGGYKMPQNGIGMCCRYSAYDDTLAYRTILWYLMEGGRHIDGAHLYLNHQAIGKGMNEAISQKGIDRSEIFITTKIFPSHFGYETTLATVPKFLKELGVEYIDLVLMHAPSIPVYPNECTRKGISASDCRKETWRALSELRQQGLLRNVGVSNFAVSHLKELMSLGLAPIANNQIQYSPFTDPAVQETFVFCKRHNITITAYSPLGGLFDKDKAFAAKLLQELSAKYEKSVSQIMLRWAMQCGAAVIPGTGNPKHMRENLQIYEFELSDADMEQINGLKHHVDAQKFTQVDVRTFA